MISHVTHSRPGQILLEGLQVGTIFTVSGITYWASQHFNSALGGLAAGAVAATIACGILTQRYNLTNRVATSNDLESRDNQMTLGWRDNLASYAAIGAIALGSVLAADSPTIRIVGGLASSFYTLAAAGAFIGDNRTLRQYERKPALREP